MLTVAKASLSLNIPRGLKHSDVLKFYEGSSQHNVIICRFQYADLNRVLDAYYICAVSMAVYTALLMELFGSYEDPSR